ncbi:RNA 2',3'-cyclic phosphodiesterase [Salidesulfovibrio brasiliensis]|uniref:RNA 2',3'-cyclic phosphodiesterase n=1 Tax=Salidesulfovibrio brasiliensis TaxID=221711 RepID=UPI0006D0E3E9|nr:RNA 2',3'-cyclic phosphodiesterase [Salidesulfovibrio brasiliensis]
MRTFLAVDVSPECREMLGKTLPVLQKDVTSRMSWTKPRNWHLTLKFLGELEPDRVVAVRKAMAGVRFDPFSLRPGNAGVFPGPKKPNVIWVGLASGAQPCHALARSVNEALTGAGFPEGRPFQAHLTIGRIKLDKGDDWRTLLGRIRKVQWPAFTVRSFTLYKSVLGPGGPKHTAIEHFPAGGPK